MSYGKNLSESQTQIQVSESSLGRCEHENRSKGNRRQKKTDGYKNPLRLEKEINHFVLSLGAGVNSTALLIYIFDKNLPLDEVVFADTGNELPETYQYLGFLKGVCKQNNVKFTTVQFEDLYNHCHKRDIIPSRNFRWCSEKFKKRPIYKYLKKKGNIICYMGFASDEGRRMRPSGQKWITNLFPLVDAGITRQKCIELIKTKGWPVPVKSGCFFCPFQSVKGWRDLYLKNKELYFISELLEKSNSKYPKFVFSRKPLVNLKSGFGDGSVSLEDFFIPKCDSGFCFV